MRSGAAVRIDLARALFDIPAIHERMQHVNGEAIVAVLKNLIHAHYPEHPFGDLWRAVAVEHPTHDAFWDARNTRTLLGWRRHPGLPRRGLGQCPAAPAVDLHRLGRAAA